VAFDLHLRKISAWRPPDEGAVRLVIASNGVPYLQNEIDRTAQPVRKVDRGKEGKNMAFLLWK
jgi:hypothetical protein